MEKQKVLDAVDVLRLFNADPKQTPKMVCERLRKSLSWVNNCVFHLKKLGLIHTVSHGLYTLTDLGRVVLDAHEGRLVLGSHAPVGAKKKWR